MRKPKRRVWGSGTVWQRGQRWWIQWREGGRRRAKSYADEDTARRVLGKILADIATGKAGLPPDPTEAPTLATLVTPWLLRRQATHRSWRSDVGRWRLHLAPVFGNMRPAEVDGASIRRFVEAKLAAGLAAQTVAHCVRLLSTFFADIVEQGHTKANPVAALPRSTRRLFRSTYDCASTPFLSRQEDITRLYRALEPPHSVIFAVGCMAGLRVGEILGLDWKSVDLEARRIRVHQQAQGGRLTCVKDDEGRLTPISTSLAPVLIQWRLATGGQGLVFQPENPAKGGRPDLGRPAQFVRPATVHAALAKALKACGLPKMTLYQVTRHSFASQWTMNGGSLELLAKILGHSSTSTTQHYSHLRPDFFGAKAHDMVTADLSKPAGTVVSLPPASGQDQRRMATTQEVTQERKLA